MNAVIDLRPAQRQKALLLAKRDPVAEQQARLIIELALMDTGLFLPLFHPGPSLNIARGALAWLQNQVTNEADWQAILTAIEGPAAKIAAHRLGTGVVKVLHPNDTWPSIGPATMRLAIQISSQNFGAIPPSIIVAILQSLMTFLSLCQPQPVPPPVQAARIKFEVKNRPNQAYRVCRRHAWRLGLNIDHANMAAQSTCRVINTVEPQMIEAILKEHP